MGRTTSNIEQELSPHLIAGWVGDYEHSSSRAHVMVDLLAALEPTAHYSVQVVEEGDGPAVHCAFANKTDADRFAAAVGARPVGKYAGYRSQRSFVLDEKTCKAIQRALDGQRRDRPQTRDTGQAFTAARL